MTVPRRRLRAIGENIDKIIKPILGRRGFSAPTIVTNWKDIVGPVLAKHTAPEQVRYTGNSRTGGSLQLRIDSSALALELQHLEPQLRERINTHFGYCAIKKIKILQGPLPEISEESKLLDRPLTRNQQDELDARLQSVSDPDLRSALAALGASITLS